MMKKLLRKLRAPRGIVPILGVALLSIPLGSFGNDREAYAERGSFSIPVGLTAKDTTLDLSGQWYFRYGEWIDPAEILQTFRDSPNFIDVPSSWRSLNEALSSKGIATYALKLSFPEPGHWTISSPLADTALRLIVWNPRTNTTELERVLGMPSKIADNERLAGKQSQLTRFEIKETGDRVLILHVSNHRHASGSVWKAPRLGHFEILRAEILWLYILSATLIGVLVFTMLHHLSLYWAERSQKSNLSFSLLAFSVALRELSTAGFSAEVGIDKGQLELIEYASLGMMPIACMMYLSHLFSRFDPRVWLRYLAYGLGAPLVVLPFLTAPEVYTSIVPLYQAYVILTSSIMSIRLFWIRKQGDDFTTHIFTAMVIVLLASIHDILTHFNVIDSILIGPLAILSFALVQTWVSAKLAKKASDERFILQERMLKQTLRMSEEAHRAERAKEAQMVAENETRVIATSRVNLFSSAVHHLNNPLNHIQGGIMNLAQSTKDTYTSIFAVIDPNDPDPDAQRFYRDLRDKQVNATQSIDIMTQGIERAVDAIDYLRVLSGMDGVSFQGSVLGNTLDILFSRMKEELRDCSWSGLHPYAELVCVGHPVLYAQSLETLITALIKDGRRVEAIEVISGTEYHQFSILAADNPTDDAEKLTGASDLEKSRELAEFVLRAYRCAVEIDERGARMQVLATLPENSNDSIETN